MQIKQLFHTSAEYPVALAEINEPPQSLYVLGAIPDEPMVAIVGTRRMTSYGKAQTYQIASDLARAGVCIVSGLASGVDGIAHQAALDAGGKTVAVMGGGLDNIYPSHHRQLAKDILAGGGALISEYPVGQRPRQFHFVDRNRIIAGLSIATIVTEAPTESGALHTATYANEAGRLVMVVPGDVTREMSQGTNSLLREGAIPVTSSDQIIEDLNLPGIKRSEVFQANNPYEKRILELLKQGINTSQELINQTGLTPSEFANLISLMEITGAVRNLGGGLWAARGPKVTAKRA